MSTRLPGNISCHSAITASRRVGRSAASRPSASASLYPMRFIISSCISCASNISSRVAVGFDFSICDTTVGLRRPRNDHGASERRP